MIPKILIIVKCLGSGACMHACVLSCVSHVQLFATPWTVAHQALLSMGFSRQEYWSGLPCPPPGDLSEPGIKSKSLTSPVLAGGFSTTSTTWEALGSGDCVQIPIYRVILGESGTILGVSFLICQGNNTSYLVGLR